MLNALPVVMIRNEETWIARVLAPALAVFGTAVVGDTGSTDGTLEILGRIPNVELIQLGELEPVYLGLARQELAQRAGQLGAEFAIMIDGDELYNVDALRAVRAEGMPAGKQAGFVNMLSLDYDEPGADLWELDDLFNRLCVFPVGDRWMGEYPFESPECFGKPDTFHYFGLPAGYRYHALHLHRLQRSGRDADVYMRQRKQKQFCLQDVEIPRTRPFDLAAWEHRDGS